MENRFNEDIFVIDCWPDNKEKEEVLINLIERLKTYNIPIILCGHYTVSPHIQEMVDYYLYDKNNDIINLNEFEEYGVNSDRWTETNDYKIVNKVDFHHDYSIWLTMKNTFMFANQLGKKYIHFLEYDNLPDLIQYRQAFIEYVRNYDVVLYEYDEGSTKFDDPYCSTYIFSIQTDLALNVIKQINSKEEYFKGDTGKWQLEKRFFNTLRRLTTNYVVSKYIPNDNELNLFAVWNRNGILRNGAKFQTYLCVDDNDILYLHLISGFHNDPADSDYLIEICYGDIKTFYNLKIGELHLMRLGKYQPYNHVNLYYQGMNVFKQQLPNDINNFKFKNQLIHKHKKSNRSVNINFIDGAFVEITDDVDFKYLVEFINQKNNKVEYSVNLSSNTWARTTIKYHVDWLIRIKGIDNDYYHEHHYEPKDRNVLISFESKSLGDTLAFIPYVEEYRLKHGCNMYCSTFNNDLFRSVYSNITFVEPGEQVFDVYALFRLGVFFTDSNVDFEKHPIDPFQEPLLKVSSDILNLDYKELRARVPKIGKRKHKRVCIAVHSTSQCKYWNNETGWQEVVDYLNELGYEVRLLSREEDGFMGNFNPKNVTIQESGSLIELIKVLQESEFFIGISSGLSWLSWVCGIPTVIISGFTDKYLEPFDNVYRVINKEVCNGCWHTHKFDPSDWNWCPIHKDTERKFECSKTITSQDVIKHVNKLIK
jgi:autotransporter strand-loop-strand O-heptosyltransferase